MLLTFALTPFTVRNEVAKVMFLQASVFPQGDGVSASVHAGMPQPPGADTPLEQTPRNRHPPGADPDPPSREQTPPLWSRHPPSGSRYPWEQTLPIPGADTSPEQTPPRDTATAADGTHPTGMHSCFNHKLNKINLSC